MKAINLAGILVRIEKRIAYLDNAIGRQINEVIEGDIETIAELRRAQKDYYLLCGEKRGLEYIRDNIETQSE